MDKDKSFVPTVEWMAKKYDEMNAELFEGKLGTCDFDVFTIGRGSGGSVLGWFKITGSGIKIDLRYRKMYVQNYYLGKELVNKDNFVEICKPKIELNGNYHGTEHGFLCTLVHEMCHYYTYMDGWAPTQAHGREFKEIGYLVSSRSNGLFTIQRLASAEQMSEFELNDEMKAKKEKRISNKKSKVTAVIVFRNNGKIELTLTSNDKLIDIIKSHYDEKGEKVVVTKDKNIIDFLFSKHYNQDMRTWKVWYLDEAPWIEEFKSMLNYNNKPQNDILPVKEKAPKKTFCIKTTNGTFECDATSEENLINSIKKQFPKMSDETIQRIINNPSNYKMNERKKNIKSIINEVIDEFIENENLNNRKGSIEINPNMNLGVYSPLELNN